MSDYKIPDLPSDDELGLTDEDKEKYGDAAGEGDGPELSPAEQADLLGGAPPSPPPPPPGGDKPPKPPKQKREPGPLEPSGPKKAWRGPVMLLALAAVAFLASPWRMMPGPVPANAPDSVFSSARAMAHDVEIARTAHPTGSPANDAVRAYVVERLQDLGLEPEVHTRLPMIGRETHVRAATVRNIVARIPGTASTGAVLLMAHYDGAGIARAAADDGAGVVTILETLRALRSGPPLKNDLIVLISDGEELGLMGARAFVAQNPWLGDVSVVLNVEMRGGGGPSIMFETGAENGWIVHAMKSAGIHPFANSFSYEIYKRLPNDTDLTPLKGAGKQGLNFAGIARASVYHQTYDEPSNLSEATLQHHGDNLLGMARALGDANLASVNDADVTYFTLPFVGTVIYGMGLVLPILGVAVLLALVTLLAVVRTSGRWTGILAGLLLGVASLAGTAAIGWGLLKWLPRFHPEYGSLVGSTFHHEGWYVLALTFAGLAVVTTLFGMARRWFRAPELTWGALLLPLGLAGYLSFTMPAAAMDMQWPVVAALAGIFFLMLPAGPKTSTLAWLLVLVAAIPVLVFLEPLTEFLWLGLSFGAAPVVGGVITLVLLLLLPALERLREPNRWWAPVLGLALGGALLGMGIRAAKPTAERPAPSTLAWAYDRGTGEALWVTDDSEDPVDQPAQAWVRAHAVADFVAQRSLVAYGYQPHGGAPAGHEPRVAQADTVSVPPLQIWAVSDTVLMGTRRVRLAIRSAMGAEKMVFLFPEGGATRLVALDGRPLPIQERPTVVDYWGRPDPALFVDLEMPAGTSVDMDVVEHLLRPGELLGADHFQRPPELAPDVTWLSDRAMVRTPAAFLQIQPGPPPFPTEPAADESETPTPVQATDTLAAPADTVADTTGVVPDTVPDSLAAPPDTTPAGADTVPAADTLSPDTTAAGRASTPGSR